MRRADSPGLTAATLTCILFFAAAAPCSASIVFTGSGSNSPENGNASLAASAEFTLESGVTTDRLIIVLTNTSDQVYEPGGVKAVPSDLLLGLFFDIDVDGALPSLTYESALAPQVIQPAASDVDVMYPGVEGGWRYAEDISDSLSGVTQHYGLGSAGYDIFGGGGGGQQFDYGIINDDYIPGTSFANKPLASQLLVQDSITFSLTLPTGILSSSLDEITNVRFQYGTSLDEPSFDGTAVANPEPATLVIWSLLGFAGLGYGWRKRRQAA